MFDDFYGLAARPFQLTPDPAFYFQSLTHRKALSYLGYGLAQGEGFIVITGEVGAGKSTLVAHLMATIDLDRLTAAQIVTSRLGGDEMIHVVAQAFGLNVAGHDKASALGAIEVFLHEEAREGRRCLLIVDESQNLSVEALEELRMLSNFQLGAHPLLQTLLLGQPEFRDTVKYHDGLEQLRQRVIAIHHLDPMDSDEVQPYIEHRLVCAGWQGSPSFGDGVYAKLHEVTGGMPRRLNQVLSRVLLLGSLEKRDHIDLTMLETVLDELESDGNLGLPVKRGAVQPIPEEVEVDETPAEAPLIASIPSAIIPQNSPVSSGQNSSEGLPSAASLASGHSADFESALAARDAQIAELQQAFMELAVGKETAEVRQQEVATASQEEIEALKARISSLENQLIEQDRTIRHTLTMLIEWIEADEQQRAAA